MLAILDRLLEPARPISCPLGKAVHGLLTGTVRRRRVRHIDAELKDAGRIQNRMLRWRVGGATEKFVEIDLQIGVGRSDVNMQSRRGRLSTDKTSDEF